MPTDKEIRAIQSAHPTENDPMPFAQALIAATVAKLAAGVSVEPHECVWEPDGTFNIGQERCLSPNTGPCNGWNIYPVYTADAIAAARVQALEEAARVCESTVWSADIDVWRDMTKKDVSVKSMLACADAIRALIGKETP